MTEPEQHADLKICINCLQSAKIRLRIVDRIFAGDLKIEDEAITAEFACLQFRRCLELIAYASVAVHKEIYARAQQFRPTTTLRCCRRETRVCSCHSPCRRTTHDPQLGSVRARRNPQVMLYGVRQRKVAGVREFGCPEEGTAHLSGPNGANSLALR